MLPVSTMEEIEQAEKRIENSEIVVFLFVKPTETAILNEFEYIHYNSENYCSVYAVGYTDDPAKKNKKTYRAVKAPMENEWYFSTKAFVEFKNKLQDRIQWQYSGEVEILILQNNPGGISALNFQNYVAIDINKGIREGYVDSFQSFMEALVRSAKANVTVKTAVQEMRRSRISVRDILIGAIDDCKKVPTPVKEIIRDRLFYRSAGSMKVPEA